MIICQVCKSKVNGNDFVCQSCGFRPEIIDDFVAWEPSLAHVNDGFSAEDFSELFKIEADNFWFQSRNRLIIWALKKYFPNFQSLLEVGCGTGFVLSGISQAFPQAKLSGSEIYTAGLSFAQQRVPQAQLMQADARNLPFREEFDVIAAFDVIEHIDEDEKALKSIFNAIKPGGGCIITVPQHMWLWSKVDEAACHKRRYNNLELRRKLSDAGFKVRYSTSFVSLLLPVMMLSRITKKSDDTDVSPESLKIHPMLNSILTSILSIERLLISYGLRFPLGGSRLIVATKEDS